MKNKILAITLLVLLNFSSGAVPETITIQGTLQAPGGDPLVGTFPCRIGYYTVEIGGTEQAFATGTFTTSELGRFAFETVFPAILLGEDDLWYQLAVDTGDDGFQGTDRFPERVHVHSVPFALNSGSLAGLHATSFVRIDQVDEQAWSLSGNTGAGAPFLGTTDDATLEIRVNNRTALRIVPNATSPNLVGGYSGNRVASGIVGAAIGGGGNEIGAIFTGPNQVFQNYGTVGGGSGNRAGANGGMTFFQDHDTVGGGFGNIASGGFSTVGGGFENRTSGRWSAIAGGHRHIASEEFSTVGGGDRNLAAARETTISGGVVNTADGIGATISGGFRNRASGGYSVVSGGSENSADGFWSSALGGSQNRATGEASTVGGGQDHLANGFGATIAGGNVNFAGFLATVGGGQNNYATGDWSTVCGGNANSATGSFSMVAGGDRNAAVGEASFAAGRRAKALGNGAFVFADSNNFDFEYSNDNYYAVRCTGGATFVTGINGGGVPTSGVFINAGGNAWSTKCDRESKTNYEDVDGNEILHRLDAIPIQTWNLKSQDPSIRHIGPVAQDFHAAFGVGEDNLHIGTVDADGVALAAIQGLYVLLKEKDKEISELKGRLERLEKTVEDR
jgi:hypothetical protein